MASSFVRVVSLCLCVVSPLAVTTVNGDPSQLAAQRRSSRTGQLPRFTEYYEAGEDAYLEERWQDCVDYMHNSIESYRNYTDVVVSCRRNCKALTRRERTPTVRKTILIALSLSLCLTTNPSLAQLYISTAHYSILVFLFHRFYPL